MTTAAVRQLPVVQEPIRLRCGHHIDLDEGERAVLARLAADLSITQIAGDTHTSISSTRSRLRDLRAKTAAANWSQVVDTACRARLLIPPPGRLTRPLAPPAVAAVQAVAHGATREAIAAQQGVEASTISKRLAAVRFRMRTMGTPAAAFRLHGVPGILDDAPLCPTCTRDGAP
ncbi:hypothetical protein ACFYUY_23840 [Kitasatospora sp. NPDC004745]|uniref:hypothetical protein n=1 Tax=Kitasatospora sp. NPDC004745 TaxID=3364019 RepID=UPI00368877FA